MKNRFSVRFPIFLSQGRTLPDCTTTLLILFKKKLLGWSYETPGSNFTQKKPENVKHNRAILVLF